MIDDCERLAVAALAMLINDYGHMPDCWQDQQGMKGVLVFGGRCMSEPCAIARYVIGIEQLHEGSLDKVRVILNRAKGDYRQMMGWEK